MEIFNNNLCEKPLDWEDRYNKMSESSKKRAKSFKFVGVLKSFTKKDKEGTYSYFTFTKKFYDMIPDITSNDDENKKAPSTAIDETQKQNNSTDNSIPQSEEKYTENEEKNKESNTSKILEAIEKSCVAIKKVDLSKCEEEFTDIDRLKKALEICEGNSSNGIKALRLAYKNAYDSNNGNSNGKGAGHGVNNTFKKHSPSELEKLLKEGQKGKFKDLDNAVKEFVPNFPI